MKRVFFDKLDSRNNRIMAVPMIIFMAIYIYTGIFDRESTLHTISAIIGFGFAIIILGKQIFFRNYIGWNKKGIMLRLNTFSSKNIAFNKIESYYIKGDLLEIMRKDGRKFDFQLKDIGEDQVNRILEIMHENTAADHIYDKSLL